VDYIVVMSSLLWEDKAMKSISFPNVQKADLRDKYSCSIMVIAEKL